MNVEDDSDPVESPGEGLLSFAGAILGVLVLIGLCVGVPVLAAKFVHPLIGVSLTIASFLVWARFGPQPVPGFLNGIVCLWGFAAILGTAIACLRLAFM